MGQKQRRQLARLREHCSALRRAFTILETERDRAVHDLNTLMKTPTPRNGVGIACVRAAGSLQDRTAITLHVEGLPREVSVESIEPLVAACVRRSIEELQRRAGKAQEDPSADPRSDRSGRSRAHHPA